MNSRLLDKVTDKEMAKIVLLSTKYDLKYQRFLTDESIQLFNNTFVELTKNGIIKLDETGVPFVTAEIDIEVDEESIADLEMFRKKFFKSNVKVDNRYTHPSQTEDYQELVSLWEIALSKYTYKDILKATDTYINEKMKNGEHDYIASDRKFLKQHLEVYIDFIRSEKQNINKDGIYYD